MLFCYFFFFCNEKLMRNLVLNCPTFLVKTKNVIIRKFKKNYKKSQQHQISMYPNSTQEAKIFFKIYHVYISATINIWWKTYDPQLFLSYYKKTKLILSKTCFHTFFFNCFSGLFCKVLGIFYILSIPSSQWSNYPFSTRNQPYSWRPFFPKATKSDVSQKEKHIILKPLDTFIESKIKITKNNLKKLHFMMTSN